MHRDQLGEAAPDKVFRDLLHLDRSKMKLALPLRIDEAEARDVSGPRLEADIALRAPWHSVMRALVSIESGKKSTGLG